MNKLITIILLFLTSFASSQTQYRFQKKINLSQPTSSSYASNIIQTSDKGFAFAGTSELNWPIRLIKFIKMDSTGTIEWKKEYQCDSSLLEVRTITSIPGGYYITGTNYTTGGFCFKTDMAGNVIWSKNYSTIIIFTSITKNNGLLLVSTNGSINYGRQIQATKIDSNGNVLWSRQFSQLVNSGVRGLIAVTKQNGAEDYIILAKAYQEYGHQMILTRINENGSLLWTNLYPATYDGYGICKSDNEGCAITGPGFLMKMDSLGNNVWTKHYLASSGSLFSSGITRTSDNGYAISIGKDPNNSYYYAGLIKFDSFGNVQRAKTYSSTVVPPSNFPQPILQTLDHGFILIGQDYPQNPPFNIFLVKTDELCNAGCSTTNFAVTTTLDTFSILHDSIQVTGSDSATNFVLTNPSSPDSIQTICFSQTATGIQKAKKELSISIYPNPSNGKFTIDLTDIQNGEIEIYDVLGKIIFRKEISATKNEIDISDRSNGLYFLRMKSENKVFSQKIILSK